MSNDEIIEFILKTLHENALFIYILGSFGTENFNIHSDIDIAVFWKSAPELNFKLNVINSLETELNRDIDLINLNDIDPIFARQVLEKGRLIFINPHFKGDHLNWCSTQLSIYPDFKFSRRIIEDQILKRKKYV